MGSSPIIGIEIINEREIIMYKCKCGREFEKKQSYVAHCGHCKTHLGRDPKDRFGDSRAWSRGLTKETDERIRRMSEESRLREPNFKGKKHNEQTKKIISEKAKYNAKNHLNGWKSGDNRVQNRYEEYTERFLKEHNISYEKEVVIPQSKLGKSGSYYRMDFLINKTIDLEIDGTAHDEHHDEERDYYLGKLYSIYRIKHNDSIELLEEKLNVFLQCFL